ncbi:MAG: hypothetical protein AMXMBFR84_04650 [Candidatus Hydrogenedentota bacterium]
MTEVSPDQLQAAVEGTHGCHASNPRPEWVTETFQGQTVWDGVVHTFDVDHPDAKVCYAWSAAVDGTENRKFYAVLGIPPINSARDAVRAAIVAENR